MWLSLPARRPPSRSPRKKQITKCSFIPVSIYTSRPFRKSWQTDRPTSQPTDRPTDGHEVSLGSYTSNNLSTDSDQSIRAVRKKNKDSQISISLKGLQYSTVQYSTVRHRCVAYNRFREILIGATHVSDSLSEKADLLRCHASKYYLPNNITSDRQ